nr:trichohyalin-like [Procambarus clarkii]
MACEVETGAVSRLRSEVNSLWRKAVRGETMVYGGDSVGVHRTKWTCQASGTLSAFDLGFDDNPSQVTKGRLHNLQDEVGALEARVTQVVQASCDSCELVSVPRIQEIELLISQVALIKRLFKHMQEEGKEAYNNLEQEEAELEKDVVALRSVLSQEFESVAKEKRKSERTLKSKVSNSFDISSHTTPKKEIERSDLFETNSDQIEQIKNPVIPYFKYTWEEKDHFQFVKVYKRYRSSQRRLEEWKRIFPYKTEADILEHASGYGSYLEKRENVKYQLLEWRNERERVKKHSQEDALKEKEETEKKRLLAKNAKEEKLKREQEMRFEKLGKWQKIKKEQESTTQKAEECLEKPGGKKNFTKACSQKSGCFTNEERQIIAVQLEVYHKKKQQQAKEKIREKQEGEKLKAQLYSESHRREFRRRDEQYIKNKKELKELQIKVKEEQKKRLDKIKSSVQINVDKSRSHLYQPTLSHTIYRVSPRVEASSVISLANIPRLATPKWRKET